MAKKKELSPEERLEAALVPKEEWLYEVPGNWCWVYLTKGCAECKDSYRKPINATERAGRMGDIPYYGATGQVGWIDDFLTDEELVLLGEDGAPFLELLKDKAYLISGKAWVNNHAHILKSFFGHIGNLYLVNYLNIFNFTGYVNGTTRLKLTQSTMDTIPVPLPPLPEQHRIVSRIESLFAKLDEAKEAAQAVVDGLEDRKAAILHKAFTGELTKEWRKQPEHPSFRKSVSIKSVCKSLKYGTGSKSVPKGSIAVIRMGNLQDGEIDWSNLVYSNNEVDNQKYRLSDGDVLFNRTNSAEHVGKTAIYRGDYPAIYAGYLIKLDYDQSMIMGDYLNYLLNGPEAKEYCNMVKTDAVNQSNINAQKIGAFEIPLIGMDEQKEVVRVIHNVINQDSAAKESAESVLDQIDTMKKSILARAFRGELGTNDIQDESAVELLKRVLSSG